MSELLDLPVHGLVTAMRRGDVTATEVCDAHIAHLERVNPALNAMVADRLGDARAEARAATERYARGGDDLPPLLGVPCTIKEIMAVRGMPHTAGIPARRTLIADRDATVVERVRAAGAIILGVTNVPEGGMWMETHNRLWGRTSNPWHLGRTPGGSSGGEAALVAVGASPFGVGSDVGGSIRIPAAFCGVFGHKPSGRLVPNTGHWPGGDASAGVLTIGPITRTADDLWPLLRILAGPDGEDACVIERAIEDPAAIDPRQLTVYPVPGNGRTRVAPEVRAAVERAGDALVDAGARLGHLPEARLSKALEIWAGTMANLGAATYAELLGDGEAIPIARELVKLAAGRSAHTLPAVVTAGLQQLDGLAKGMLEKSALAGRALQAELEALLGPHGVLLHPPYATTAPRHVLALLRPLDFVCTGLFNALEFPSTVAPVGFDKHRLPLGVQIIGARGRDQVTIAAARVLERQLGGWVRPPVPTPRKSLFAPLLDYRR